MIIALGKAYTDDIDKYEKNYIKKVGINESVLCTNICYLPHFPVVKPDRETTKIRLVYDVSAKYNESCLNDMTSNGPK